MVQEYDLCVIGGGINGAGIARDAAGRGLKVFLAEKGDIAGATSSASTKLIHGGLRYLEHFEFGLVRDSLRERETLLTIAPHLVRPRSFILPHDPKRRSYWLVGLGLTLYDRLARRKRLPRSRRVKFEQDETPLKDIYAKGFCYWDCWTDDSRLVTLNMLDAAEHGAVIAPHTEVVGLKAQGERWRVYLKDAKGTREIDAAMVVNATGPWVRNVIDRFGLAASDTPQVKLVKGSHIIVRKAYGGDDAFLLQQADNRVVFIIPYEGDFTLIGTTEEAFSESDPADPQISDKEIEYLCSAFNTSFNKTIAKEDVLWTFSGVRPLFDDGKQNASAVTRDFRLYKHEGLGAPFLSIFGGKLTTYRTLSEKAVTMIGSELEQPAEPWTAKEPLPGGDIAHGDLRVFMEKKGLQYDWLLPAMLRRYAHSYGARMDRFLDGAKSLKDLGQYFGDELYEAEVTYLVRNEWAREAEDILWRRTKVGLRASEQTVKNLEKALPKIIEKALS